MAAGTAITGKKIELEAESDTKYRRFESFCLWWNRVIMTTIIDETSR